MMQRKVPTATRLRQPVLIGGARNLVFVNAMPWVLRFVVTSVLVTAAVFAAAEQPVPTRELITCGRERVHILDLNARDANGTPQIVWTWQAADRTDLPADYKPRFRSTDECKPVDGGRRILITSSSGAVALVDRAKNAVVFYGRAVNAHSADVLPHNRIAVAASHDPRENKGDALILFDIGTSDREIGRSPLPAGHGVVWDEKRQVLWALSNNHIHRYVLRDWTTASPRLEQVGAIALPESSGHDFYPVPGTAMLSVTTATHCWLFDRDRQTLTPHPLLGDKAAIKSITVHPTTGQIAFTEAERPEWWTTRVQFFKPNDVVTVPGEQFYKVRWNLAPE